MFDLSLPKLLVLTVIALVIFRPNDLPKIAFQVGRALRDLRKIAEGAKNDLREGLGPEFAGFEIEDLNPKRFVHKHLLGDLNADQAAQQQPAPQATANGTPPTPDERPPSGPAFPDSSSPTAPAAQTTEVQEEPDVTGGPCWLPSGRAGRGTGERAGGRPQP